MYCRPICVYQMESDSERAILCEWYVYIYHQIWQGDYRGISSMDFAVNGYFTSIFFDQIAYILYLVLERNYAYLLTAIIFTFGFLLNFVVAWFLSCCNCRFEIWDTRFARDQHLLFNNLDTARIKTFDSIKSDWAEISTLVMDIS